MSHLAVLLGVAASVTGPAVDDVVAPIVRFEATTDATGAAGWTALTTGQVATGDRWARARASIALTTEPQSGRWLLVLGRATHDATATLNGQTLPACRDACSDDVHLAAGPCFDVSGALLHAGANALELSFSGASLGRGFERGAAYLLSPIPAARLRDSLAAGDLVVPLANFATLATGAQSMHPLDRVLFKFAEDGGEARLAGQLDCSVVDSAHNLEIPLRKLADRKGSIRFPIAGLQIQDPALDAFLARFTAFAPVLSASLRFADAKALLFEIGQTTRRETFEFDWRLRFFPAIGGPLRVTRGNHFVLLHNELVGLFAKDGKVLGSDEAPVGIQIVLKNESKPGHLQPLAGPSLRCGIVGFERGAADPSGADSMEALVAACLDEEKNQLPAITALSDTIGSEPAPAGTAIGEAARMSSAASLAAMKLIGGHYLFAPPAGVQSAEAFWSDTFTLLHFASHERATAEWLVGTQRDDGAIRGELPDDAAPAELLAADVYAVLRACRWFRWGYDGDPFVALAPKLDQALAHADAIDAEAAASEPLPAGREKLSAFHLELARIAAHQEFAKALEMRGALEELMKKSNDAAQRELAALLPPTDHGGRGSLAGRVDRSDEDPRDAAVALVYGLVEGNELAELSAKLAPRNAAKKPLDWRDALVLRGLLHCGQISAVGGRWKQLHEQTRTAPIFSTASAAYHGALGFGLLDLRRDDLGTVEIWPYAINNERALTAAELHEGPVKFMLLAPDNANRRQLVVENASSLPLMVIVGVPSEFGVGDRVRKGELRYSVHQQVIEPGKTWREVVQ